MTPENEALKQKVHDLRNDIEQCPFCNSHIADRKISLYKGLIDTPYRVYQWCGQNKKHEFSMKEVRHLIGKIEYTRFGDLVMFGGIVYRPKDEKGKRHKGEYGINMERALEFFKGERTIPMQITVDQITGEILSGVEGYVKDFPELYKFLDENGLYDHTLDVRQLTFL